ncbi:SEC-C metal-binding domain-containing protein [Rhizobium sullae]|nr:SEC-C metal-binding domain-containing protein [Rhizobium sullae]
MRPSFRLPAIFLADQQQYCGGMIPPSWREGWIAEAGDSELNDEIVRQIDNEIVEPIFRQSGDTVIAWDWAEGCAESFALRQRHWTKMAKSEAGMLLVPIIMLCEPENLPDELAIEETSRWLTKHLRPCRTPFWQFGTYWRMSKLEKKSVFAGLRSFASPDRNDPCPCGSGKKFKKCCGTGS